MPVNVWTHKLNLADVFHDDALTFEVKRDTIVRRIKAARFYDADNWTLFGIVDELADTTDVEDFDYVWSEFYDWADAERVWISTI